jgi:hypothetical protein
MAMKLCKPVNSLPLSLSRTPKVAQYMISSEVAALDSLMAIVFQRIYTYFGFERTCAQIISILEVLENTNSTINSDINLVLVSSPDG